MSTNDTQALVDALKFHPSASHVSPDFRDLFNKVLQQHADGLHHVRPALASRQDQQGQAPEGWRLVPAEPTEEMIDAACEACDRNFGREYLIRGFSAMISAAPLPHASKETSE